VHLLCLSPYTTIKFYFREKSRINDANLSPVEYRFCFIFFVVFHFGRGDDETNFPSYLERQKKMAKKAVSCILPERHPLRWDTTFISEALQVFTIMRTQTIHPF
jgi:hypothetical protein